MDQSMGHKHFHMDYNSLMDTLEDSTADTEIYTGYSYVSNKLSGQNTYGRCSIGLVSFDGESDDQA